MFEFVIFLLGFSFKGMSRNSILRMVQTKSPGITFVVLAGALTAVCSVQCTARSVSEFCSLNSDVPALRIVQKRKLGLWMSSAQRWIKTRSRTKIIALDLLIFFMIYPLLCQGKVFHVFLAKLFHIVWNTH